MANFPIATDSNLFNQSTLSTIEHNRVDFHWALRSKVLSHNITWPLLYTGKCPLQIHRPLTTIRKWRPPRQVQSLKNEPCKAQKSDGRRLLCNYVALILSRGKLNSHRASDFLDYYFHTLGYLASRKERRIRFDADTAARDLKPAEYAKEFKSYCGRERVLLRKRRAKLKVDQFHIIAQVGQGGYGDVFLARKLDTGEVCALKRMKKKALAKMDEVYYPPWHSLVLEPSLGPSRSCGTWYPHRNQDTVARPPPLCFPGPWTCQDLFIFALYMHLNKTSLADLPCDGVCSRRGLSHPTE